MQGIHLHVLFALAHTLPPDVRDYKHNTSLESNIIILNTMFNLDHVQLKGAHLMRISAGSS